MEKKSLAFKLTYLCNLNCIMCGQGKYYKKFSYKNDYVSIEKILNQVEAFDFEKVYLWGGEPLLYPNFDKLLENLKNKNVFITTNGLLLNKYAQDIIKNRVTELTISLDGFEEIHEKIRGVNDIYKKILKNIQIINSVKKENKSVFPIVDLHIVVLEDNYKTLYDFIKYIKENKLCRRVRIQLPMFFSENMIAEFHNYVDKKFSPISKKTSWSYFYVENFYIDYDILWNNIEKIKKEFKNIVLFPNDYFLDKESLKNWFSNPNHENIKVCKTSENRVNIEPNGDVIACPNFPETVCGNIHKESLKDILNNNIMTEHQKYSKNNKCSLGPRCSYYYLSYNKIGISGF
jgi:radical SAM protein with 4Fe4S-binding SPASM domain